MKRIGIITILKVNNYGAELQAYATQAALGQLGYSAEIIDYLFYKNSHHKATMMSVPVFKHGFKKRLAEYLLPKIEKMKSIRHGEAEKNREERFERFHKDNTKMSATYETIDKLYKAELNYDVYMVGSDQVWNPGIYSSLNPYFLTFAPDGKKRVSYASSFGVSKLDEAYHPFYKEVLNKMDSISVREEQAVELVKEVSGKDATWVLDPTLLLTQEQWMRVAKPADVPNEPYILIYELSNIPYIKKVAEHISQQTGLPIVRICKNASPEDNGSDIMNIIDAGPAEFLYLFDKAKYVVTNSFHGTAFSINFGKQFYTIIPKNKTNNSRQKSILKLMDCASRMLIEDSPLPQLTELNTEQVATRLQKEREKSINYLKRAIDGE